MSTPLNLLGVWCIFPGILLHPYLAGRAYLAAGGAPLTTMHAVVVFGAIAATCLIGTRLLR